MKKLLLAFDGSPCAEAAIEDLFRAGLPSELEACVLSVADVWLPSNPDKVEPVFPDTKSAAMRKAREHALQAVESSRSLAARAAERLRTLFPKWKVSSEGCGDSPAWAIIKKTDAWRADLVVLGSHGRSTLERFFLGSVSAKVAAEAHCSVRIARPRARVEHARPRIAIAVDGSPDALAAVKAVAGRSWPERSEFRVITVIDPRLETALAWPDVYAAQWVHERDEVAKESICRMVEHSARRLYDAGLIVETEILAGDPKHELLKHAEAWEADAIFIGSRGVHHGDRLALGTMASAVAARAHCSVEIVRMG